MGFARTLARQLARPHGVAGRVLGHAMDVANRRPTRLALDRLAPKAGEDVLDAGCGTGAALQAILRRAPCRTSGVDLSATMLASAKRRLGNQTQFYWAKLEALPFADRTFDAVLALNVLYFCDEEARMVASLQRILRPGGRLAVYVTDRESMKNWAFTREGMHRLYDREDLVAMLVRGGFDPGRICVHSVPVSASINGLLALASKAPEAG